MSKLLIDNPNAGYTPRTTANFSAVKAPEGLSGSRVVLFSNNKPNVDLFHNELAARLRDEHAVATTDLIGKLSAAFPAPPDVLDKVAAYQIAVNAVGD